MPSDRTTNPIDARPLLAALAAIPDAVLAHLKPESKVTADNIAAEARRRVQRQTGKTADAITVEETRNGEGYIVWVPRPDRPNLPIWLAFGTTHHGTTRTIGSDFLFAAARLEEGQMLRRARLAIQDAIDEKGMGD